MFEGEEAKIKKAKELALGPIGQCLSRFPLLFAQAAFFGQRPSRTQMVAVRNGTMTIADLGTGPLGITCQHVIARYREMIEKVEGVVFQVGSLEVNPVDQIIGEDASIDLATIRLTPEQVRAITEEGTIGSCVFQPSLWPPPAPKEGEYVAFGGFPGTLRTVASFDELDFRSWSCGASYISSVSEFHFVSKFEREYWVNSFGAGDYMDFTNFGGLSGGPAFIQRGLYWDLVGIVSEYHKNYDAVRFASTRVLRPDGTIESPPA
jgi:hypothetical protein